MSKTNDLTLWDCFNRNMSLRGDRIAFDFVGRDLTHRQLVECGYQVASWLKDKGVNRGDRVAYIADSRIELFVLIAAAAQLGAILVPINWRLSQVEILQILDDCGASIVIADTAGKALLSSAEHTVTHIDEMTELCSAQHSPDKEVGTTPIKSSISAYDPLFILYTASVDGEARGATISHRNLIASSIQMQIALGLDEHDRFLGYLPYFHMMAIALTFAVNFAGGRTTVIPRFDAEQSAHLIESERITFLGTFPPMLSGLLEQSDSQGRDFGSLRHCMGLDEAATIERFERSCPQAAFWSIYGQTETTGNVTYGRWTENPGSAGKAAALARLLIANDQGDPMPTNGIGEILVRGPSVFQGYWGRETENMHHSRDGWHHTGDLGRIDRDGWLWYSGRAPHKQLIKSGGENIYPAEVERVLCADATISHAVVFGVPDSKWGEVAVAVCELAPGATADLKRVDESMAKQLAKYKRPKKIIFVDTLPKSEGMVDRAAAQEIYAEQAATIT